ncbi:hypothetical protein C7S15_4819 [Burkholderia cepacia]|nr:hypothetical protein [Burkholderia cepacia]
MSVNALVSLCRYLDVLPAKRRRAAPGRDTRDDTETRQDLHCDLRSQPATTDVATQCARAGRLTSLRAPLPCYSSTAVDTHPRDRPHGAPARQR